MKSLWKSDKLPGESNASERDSTPWDPSPVSKVSAPLGSVSHTRTDALRGIEAAVTSRRDFLIAAGAVTCAALHLIPSAVADEQVTTKVGFVLPKQGEYEEDAKSLMSGFHLFLKENKDKVPPLELFQEDPGKGDSKALEALTSLVINRNVRFIVGPMSLDGATKAVHAVSGTEAILFVTNPLVRLVAGEMCLSASFRLGPNTYQQAKPLGPWCVKNVGLGVFLTGSDDPLGNEHADFFAHGFERAGGRFVDRIMADETADSIAAVIERIRETKPDLVFASFSNERAVVFVRAFRKESFEKTPALVGPESLTSFPKVLGEIGSAATGVSTLTSLKSPNQLLHRIKEKLGTDVANVARAAEGYDLAQAICKVVGKSGDRNGNPKELIRAMQELEIDGPRGRVRFDKNHEGIFDTMVQQWDVTGSAPTQKIVAKLGPCVSPDFGCGRVGFPPKPGAAEENDRSPAEKD
jgi:branched-chain amino acid transport system substrate-binding protein